MPVDLSSYIETKVAGVTFTNPDGASRQEIIENIASIGDPLRFVREPYNKKDPNAVSVWINPERARIYQIGYLNKQVAREIASLLDMGAIVTGEITDITGGYAEKSFGVNIVVVARPDKPPPPAVAAPASPPAIVEPIARVQANAAPLEKPSRPAILRNTVVAAVAALGTLALCAAIVVGGLVAGLLIGRLLPSSAELTPETIIASFQAAGLEAVNPYMMTVEDHGIAPVSDIGIRFLIPSLCDDCGGRVLYYKDLTVRDKAVDIYTKSGQESAWLFSWVFVRDHIVVQINGDLPEDQARKYEQVLNAIP